MDEKSRIQAWVGNVVGNLEYTIKNGNVTKEEIHALQTTIAVLKRENNPVNELRDFYFSAESFREFKLEGAEKGEVVCECLIDGKWLNFTESISRGTPPLSKWKDLIFVGTSKKTRYMSVDKWLMENHYPTLEKSYAKQSENNN